MKRKILYSKENGIYLGSKEGICSWSRIGLFKKRKANTYPDHYTLEDVIGLWSLHPKNVKLISVYISGKYNYQASETECEQAIYKMEGK